MVFFDGIINLISNSKFYIFYVSQWPEPFNIVSFDAVLLIILLILGIRAVWNAVNSYRFSVRFKAKRQKLQEERIEQELRERERDKHREEDNDIIRQYLKFLSVASAHNILGTNPISLEEFKLAIQNDKETNTSGAECSESVPGQDKTSDISLGVLSGKTDEMPEKNLILLFSRKMYLKVTNWSRMHPYRKLQPMQMPMRGKCIIALLRLTKILSYPISSWITA